MSYPVEGIPGMVLSIALGMAEHSAENPSKAYYTCDGISKYIALETNDRDIWYKVFMERDTDKLYLLDVDIDAVNNRALSVFVNTAVYDEHGRYIGLCGVGVDKLMVLCR